MSKFERRIDPTPEQIQERIAEIQARPDWRRLRRGKIQEPKGGCRLYRCIHSTGNIFQELQQVGRASG